jgi:hypothetical protein
VSDYFPDSNEWTTFFSGSGGTLKSAMNKLEYTGPLEEFTMALCMFLQPEAIALGKKFFEQRAAEMKKIQLSFYKKHGLKCCPGYVADVLVRRKSET